ncbi:hypothetical protein [Mycolicibacterium komossense]|uniref:hypothetical protein n=1 Tax=Mycolicibacterium komossense TaxID=1779 RepID=UPI0021F2CF79|nr:hypothetical protein [Mycolicibacterium komossense]
MMAFRGQSLRRYLTAGGFAVATLAAPAVMLMSGPSVGSAPVPLADCGGVPVGLQGLGAYTTNCDLAVQPPAAIGAAPSAGAVVACRNIPGCLSQWVNNPGQVQVPQRSTAIVNSQ